MKILTYVLAIVLLATSVAASPGFPHQFYGTVTTNGFAAADDLFVYAKIDGSQVAVSLTVDGQYGIPGDNRMIIMNSDGSRVPGTTIEFYVEDVKAAEFLFDPGQVTELNLVVSGDFQTPPVTPPPENNPSSPSNRRSTSSRTIEFVTNDTNETATVIIPLDDNIQETCSVAWKCSEWLDCVNAEQKRFCFDVNRCDSEAGMPETERSCDLPKELQEDKGFIPGIQAFVAGNTGAASVIGLLIIVGIIAGLFAVRKGYLKK